MEEFGGGFSRANLEYMRRFYLEWRHREQRISQTVSGKSKVDEISQTLSAQFTIAQTAFGQSGSPLFTLSWSHYVLLLTIKNPEERSFYEVEAYQSNWSFRELKRMVGDGYLILSGSGRGAHYLLGPALARLLQK